MGSGGGGGEGSGDDGQGGEGAGDGGGGTSGSGGEGDGDEGGGDCGEGGQGLCGNSGGDVEGVGCEGGCGDGSGGQGSGGGGGEGSGESGGGRGEGSGASAKRRVGRESVPDNSAGLHLPCLGFPFCRSGSTLITASHAMRSRTKMKASSAKRDTVTILRRRRAEARSAAGGMGRTFEETQPHSELSLSAGCPARVHEEANGGPIDRKRPPFLRA